MRNDGRCENFGGHRWAGMCLGPAVTERNIEGRPTLLCADCDEREPKESDQ